MKCLMKPALSAFITIGAMAPTLTWSATVTVDNAARTLDLSGMTSTGTTSTGSYSDSLWAGPNGETTFVSSNIPSSGSYSSYVINAEMYSFLDEREGPALDVAQAEMSVTFTLDSAVNYVFSGSAVGGNSAGYDLSLNGPGGEICSLSSSCLSSSGVLLAGQYELYAMTAATLSPGGAAIGDVRLDFDMTLSEVPVPAAIWLFGSGLLGLIGIARRRS